MRRRLLAIGIAFVTALSVWVPVHAATVTQLDTPKDDNVSCSGDHSVLPCKPQGSGLIVGYSDGTKECGGLHCEIFTTLEWDGFFWSTVEGSERRGYGYVKGCQAGKHKYKTHFSERVTYSQQNCVTVGPFGGCYNSLKTKEFTDDSYESNLLNCPQ